MKNLSMLWVIMLLFAACAAGPKTAEKSPAAASEPVLKPESPTAEKPMLDRVKDDKKSKLAEESEMPSSTRAATDDRIALFAETSPRKTAPSESGLKAGYSDDNEQFNYFVKFLEKYQAEVESYPLNIGERIILSVRDVNGKPVSNAEVSVKADGKTITGGRTYASGTFHLFPLEYPKAASYRVSIAGAAGQKEILIDRNGPRTIDITLDGPRKALKEVPLDILFILDTTGSMGEEIERLRSTIEIINENIGAVTPRPRVRFGLVLYRDQEDEYLTQVVPFTSDLASFQKDLDAIVADGGGDSPEDLQSALSDALTRMEWNKDGIRLAFTVTDAEPHLDYEQTFTYADAARQAKAMGIKLYTVGTGGLPLQGEYVLRQISQFTGARYIFLTYGEQGESEGGKEASVSHHTGSNFQTDKLEAIIIRFTREELSFLSETPLQKDDPWFDAKKISDENRDETLSKLFQESLQNLTDYSTFSVGPTTRSAFLPITVAETDGSELKKQAEYFSESLLLAALAKKPFIVVERKDIQKILAEQQLQYSGAVSDDTAIRLGALLGAEVLVTGKLYIRNSKYEIFLKLLRVETGEILSVSRAKLTTDLGL